MTAPTTHILRSLPRDTQTRLQYLLDQGDQRFFADHPRETERRRLYFKGERVDDHGDPTRYIRVFRQADGSVLRRFEQEGGQA